jgi:hypothetical protein
MHDEDYMDSRSFRAIAALLLAVLVHPVLAQDQSARQARRTYIEPSTVPSSIRAIVTALGQRVQRSGLERVTLTGILDRSGMTSNVRVIRELPGYLRVDEAGAKNQSLVFDLSELKGSVAISADDEDLAEMLECDTAESFLAQIGPGAGIRKLGDRFLVKGQSGFGAVVDIYEFVAPVSVRRDRMIRAKHFMFDSGSGLLRRVAYRTKQSGREILVQTVYSSYSNVAGHLIPTEITRIADGTTVLSFRVNSATVSPRMTDGSFVDIQK